MLDKEIGGVKYYWFLHGCRPEPSKEIIGADPDKEAYRKSIGNYFETKEEAEKAVERLRAWKRLKDSGFKFVGWCDSLSDNNPDMALFKLNEHAWETATCDDLDLLFGGEE